MECQCCGNDGAKKRRQNTAYVNDESNFATLCNECQKESHKYWQDQWNEYYNQVT